jgi:hypothetical protein
MSVETAFWFLGLAFIFISLVNIAGMIYIKTRVARTDEQIQKKLERQWKKRNSQKNF